MEAYTYKYCKCEFILNEKQSRLLHSYWQKDYWITTRVDKFSLRTGSKTVFWTLLLFFISKVYQPVACVQ
jgi:hypothetical protein